MLAWSPWVIDKLWFLDSSEKLRDAKADPRCPRDNIVTVDICTNRNYVTCNLSGGYSCHLVECWLYKCTHGLDLIIKYSTKTLFQTFQTVFRSKLTHHGWIFGQYIWDRKRQSQLLILLQDWRLYTRREMLQNPQ